MQAACLRSGLSFTKTTIERLEQLTTGHRAAELATARHVLTGYGVLLLSDAAGDAAALSFGKQCNLLNVNTVERVQARQDGATSFHDVAFTIAPATGAKTAKAASCSRCTAPAEQLPDPFAPGGPLYGNPVQALPP